VTRHAGRASPEVRARESTAADDAPYDAPASPPPRSAHRSGATTPPCPSPGPACPSASARPWRPPAAPTSLQCPAPTWRTRGRPPRSRTPRRSPRGCAPRAAAWRRAASPGAARSALILRTLRRKGEGGRCRWRPVPSVGGLPFTLAHTRRGLPPALTGRLQDGAGLAAHARLAQRACRRSAGGADLGHFAEGKMCKRVLFDGALPRETQTAARDAGACGATRTCTRTGNGRRDGGARRACSEEGEIVVRVFFAALCLVPWRYSPCATNAAPSPPTGPGRPRPPHLLTPQKVCLRCRRKAPYRRRRKSPFFVIFVLFFHTPLEGCDLSTPALFFSARPAPNALPNLKDAGLRKGNGETER
jgi:hypothetical protein